MKKMLLSKRFWGSCSFVAAEFVPYEKEVESATVSVRIYLRMFALV